MKGNILQGSNAYLFGAIGSAIVTLLCVNVMNTDNGVAKAADTGEKLYKLNCAVCHVAGGNIVSPKKPVIGSAMLANEHTFKNYLLKPTGAMQAFPAIANNDADLTALYKYCKSLK